jgi:hypothetical protein
MKLKNLIQDAIAHERDMDVLLYWQDAQSMDLHDGVWNSLHTDQRDYIRRLQNERPDLALQLQKEVP